MIEKKTKLDRLEMLADGAIQVRFVLSLEEDGSVLASQYHRTVLEKEVTKQCDAVSSYLENVLKYPPIPPEDQKRIAAIAEAVWKT